MPHIRKDPVTKQSVIIASERMGRPSDYINIEEKHAILPALFVKEMRIKLLNILL